MLKVPIASTWGRTKDTFVLSPFLTMNLSVTTMRKVWCCGFDDNSTAGKLLELYSLGVYSRDVRATGVDDGI